MSSVSTKREPQFKVSEKTVPLPTNGSGRPTIYPFAEMKVGQHFECPRDMGQCTLGSDKRQNNISNSARYFVKQQNPSAKFATRLIDDNTVGCWRVA